MPSPRSARRRDVAIVGGGPAGAAAARLLSDWGHDVVVVTRRADPARDLAVSLPPSIRKLLGELGVQDAIDAAGFVRSTGNTVWWGGAAPRTALFSEGETGYQVGHQELDRVLLSAAAAAGAEVVVGAGVGDVAVGREGVTLTAGAEAGVDADEVAIEADFVLDASGREGVIALGAGLRRPQSAGRTLALVAAFRRDRWDLPDETHTLVESFADGWAWSVPVADGRRYVTCMLDPGVSDLSDGSVADRYGATLRRAPAFERLLDGAEMVGEPWACDASWYDAARVSGDRFLLVGDAASFIDPLSSYGVKKALASGWLAAVVVNTRREDPSMYDAAARLFEEQERRVFETFEAQASAFFDQVAADREHAFWTGRAALGSGHAGEPDIEALRHDPEVLAAFAALKASPAIELRRASGVGVAEAPAIGERRVVLQRRLTSPALPDGVRFLRGVDVLQLVELAPRYGRVPDLFEAYNGTGEAVPLPDFLGALSVLLAKHVLRNEAVC